MSRDPVPGDDVEFDPLNEDELAGLGLEPAPLPVLPLGDEPTRTTAPYLFPTERFRGEWRRHPIRLVKGLCLIAVYTGLLITLAVQRLKPEYTTRVVALIAVGALLLAAHRAAHWWFSRFVLTNKRLMLIEGVLTRRVAMMPLLRVTDMSYFQSPTGRVLDFGTFHLESAGWRGPLRRIADLPRPNELYLRIVEEMYEPAAVEARLGASVAGAVQEALYGPPLVNYDGWLAVEVADEDGPVAVSPDRRFALYPARSYRVTITIAPFPAGGISEPLVVTGGVAEHRVRFEVEIDSDHAALRRAAAAVPAWHDRASSTEFTLGPFSEDDRLSGSPWLWVRVAQGRRTLQSIELEADLAAGGGERG
ncbi:PH domain-containing protein [Catellatospora chokoriensis]|uniref:YdbS-like PH domain-containing protein n=1 Tax=Catellatospora chokoriensis TaxID=310353 RepID=A0A8J3NTN9_9ACTN|nr:PH domain-containing protein [Catellatospora chokoriensis]GIF91916.1 hypothetical protein Cch02nite_53600 [Catellatospora chokoriensis]